MTEQLTLFDSSEYLDTTIELKIMIQKIIDCYENEESWMYCDTEAMLNLIKMLRQLIIVKLFFVLRLNLGCAF